MGNLVTKSLGEVLNGNGPKMIEFRPMAFKDKIRKANLTTLPLAIFFVVAKTSTTARIDNGFSFQRSEKLHAFIK